jgi:hypothetical protein
MLRLLPLVLALGATGCGPDPLTCAELERETAGGMLTCTPQYAPTFDNVFTNTLEPDCALGGCHAGARPRAGLDLSEIETAYEGLLAAGQERVILGDPECSEVVSRMATTDSDWHMPPGERLSDAEICAVAQWIEAGAQR